MSYGIQIGCSVEFGYNSLEEAVETIKEYCRQNCMPIDDAGMVWEDLKTGSQLRIIWMDDDEKDTMR